MTGPIYLQDRINERSVTIAKDETTSGICDLSGVGLVGILLPSAFTGTEISLSVSLDETNFFDYYFETAEFTADVTTARYIGLDYTKFFGIRYAKIVSGTAEAAARTIYFICRGI